MKSNDEREVKAQQIASGYVRRVCFANEILLQNKWKREILCVLRSGPIRLGQLTRLIPKASKKMLTQNLRKLEADGIVIRRDLSDIVLHIEYNLDDDLREAVCGLLDQLAQWGEFYLGKSK